MTTVPLPPGRTFYLRTFLVSFALVAIALIVFLFAVHMESSIPATGVLRGRDQQKVRAAASGLVEPGWYEGEWTTARGRTLRFRTDAEGDGGTDPAAGETRTVQDFVLPDGENVASAPRTFHALRAGDLVWRGQVLARLRAEAWRFPSEPSGTLVNGQEASRDHAARVLAPDTHPLWLVVQVHVEADAAVRAGDAIATLTPVDPKTHEPLDVVADLRIAESDGDELADELPVRLYSQTYNHRLYGRADGVLEHVDPAALPGADGKRYFHAVARITHAPFPLRLGTGVEAKIVAGRKPVFRIILEN